MAWLAALSASGAMAGTIAGTVQDAVSGGPVTGAAVWLEIIEGGCPTTRTETGDDGRYEFASLEPGRYRVRASRVGYVARYYAEGDEPSFGREIVVLPNERRRADVRLPPAAEVSGHVREADGRPIAGGYVFFDNLAFTSRAFHTRTDSEGYYRVADLPPGDYHVSARRYSPSARQVVGERWFHPGTTEAERAESLSLAPGSPARVDILFGGEPAPTWSVRVMGAAGEPVPRAEIALRRVDGSGERPLTCRTNDDGRCARSLAPGEYEAYLSLSPAPYGAGGREGAAPRRFRVEPGRTTHSEFRLGAGLRATALLRSRDGATPPSDHGLRFTLTHPLAGSRGADAVRVEAQLEDEGGVVFEGLGAGITYHLEVSSRDPLRRYCVSALERGGTPLRPDRVRMTREIAPPISVEITPCAVLVGRTAGTTAVRVRRIGPRLPEPLYPEEQRVEPSRGRWALRGLPAGRYVVESPGEAPLELVLGPAEVREVAGGSHAGPPRPP